MIKPALISLLPFSLLEVFFGSAACAQTVLGVKAGGQISTLIGPGTSIAPKISPSAGFIGGVYQTSPLGANGLLSLQTELLYSQQGYRLSNPSTKYSATIRFHYLAIPVLLTVTRKHFFGVAGPQVSYLAGIRERYAFQVPNAAGQTVNINTDPRGRARWDVAVAVGGGYRWTNGLSMEVRYVGSLNSVYPDRGTQQLAKPRNAGFQALASYALRK